MFGEYPAWRIISFLFWTMMGDRLADLRLRLTDDVLIVDHLGKGILEHAV